MGYSSGEGYLPGDYLRVRFEVGQSFGAVYAAPAGGVIPILGGFVAGTDASAVVADGHIVHVGCVGR